MEERIDFYPTHEVDGVRFRRGRPLPFATIIVPNGVNFSIFSSTADSCTLVLFRKHAPLPFIAIAIPREFRIGDVYSIIIFDLDCETLEYSYGFSGPWDPGAGHRYDKTKILYDPYAKVIGGRDIWRTQPTWNNIHQYCAWLLFDDFGWEGDSPLEIPMKDLVIYEAHVRGFTAHPSSKVPAPGTFGSGINCVEVLPIFEFLATLVYNPVLSRCKLVAEASDAGGLYQVGSFPAYGRWSEWNGKHSTGRCSANPTSAVPADVSPLCSAASTRFHWTTTSIPQ